VSGYYHSTFIGGRKHFRVIRSLLIAADDRAAPRISLECECCTIELILCAKNRERERERGEREHRFRDDANAIGRQFLR